MTLTTLTKRYPASILSVLLSIITSTIYLLHPAITLFWTITGIIAILVPITWARDTIAAKSFRWLSFLLVLSLSLKISAFLLKLQFHSAQSILLNHYLSAAVMLVLVIRIAMIVKQTVHNYNTLSKAAPADDFLEKMPVALKGVISGEKPRELLASEIGVMYYLYKGNQPAKGFSYHRFGGITAVYIVFIFLLLIEGAGTTILLHKLAPPVIERSLLLLSIYSVLFLIAHIRAMKQRPILLTSEYLQLRYGLLTSVRIPWTAIKEVAMNKKTFTKGNGNIKLALLSAMEQHNMRLELHMPVSVKLLFKEKKNIAHIYFRVDDQQEFINSLPALPQ
ncbi:hypothetical protein [Chitinophaga sp. Cy-1792]|uniref:hypothetical protein n=1 Tax=Chitinophaga sp. Cy-1792 TaxID=2608339 RepID=UPI00142062E9|nr:hypothetical protein [Chitinophaga sp. Cy-1792]NIG56641.1 hypothetical protein [Chitinophaga sp. Cy-1792]